MSVFNRYPTKIAIVTALLLSLSIVSANAGPRSGGGKSYSSSSYKSSNKSSSSSHLTGKYDNKFANTNNKTSNASGSTNNSTNNANQSANLSKSNTAQSSKISPQTAQTIQKNGIAVPQTYANRQFSMGSFLAGGAIGYLIASALSDNGEPNANKSVTSEELQLAIANLAEQKPELVPQLQEFIGNQLPNLQSTEAPQTATQNQSVQAQNEVVQTQQQAPQASEPPKTSLFSVFLMGFLGAMAALVGMRLFTKK